MCLYRIIDSIVLDCDSVLYFGLVLASLPMSISDVTGPRTALENVDRQNTDPPGILLINTLRPRQNGRHFADDIFKCIFVNENV